MRGRGGSPEALPKRPSTPPIEKWDCDLEEEEEEENWDTAPSLDELAWENLITPPTPDYSGIPMKEEEEEGLAAAEALLPTKENDEGVWFLCLSPCWRVRGE